MNLIEYDNSDAIHFYVENGLEFDEIRGYFGTAVKTFALMDGNIFIGPVSVSKYKDKSFIEAIAIGNSFRHKGYGKMLLDKAINELEKPVYAISKSDEFYLKNGFEYDDEDLIDKECKTCSEFNKTCFPKGVVYR